MEKAKQTDSPEDKAIPRIVDGWFVKLRNGRILGPVDDDGDTLYASSETSFRISDTDVVECKEVFPVKLYHDGEDFWVAARSREEALVEFLQCGWEDVGSEDDYMKLDDVRELTDEEMDKMIFTDEDGAKRTFREELQKNLSEGLKAPFHFAATEQYA